MAQVETKQVDMSTALGVGIDGGMEASGTMAEFPRDKYRRVEPERGYDSEGKSGNGESEGDRKAEDGVIRVQARSNASRYLRYAKNLMETTEQESCTFRGSGAAMRVAIQAAETLRFTSSCDLHKHVAIGMTGVTDRWEPIEDKSLPVVETTRMVPFIEIFLTKQASAAPKENKALEYAAPPTAAAKEDFQKLLLAAPRNSRSNGRSEGMVSTSGRERTSSRREGNRAPRRRPRNPNSNSNGNSNGQLPRDSNNSAGTDDQA